MIKMNCMKILNLMHVSCQCVGRGRDYRPWIQLASFQGCKDSSTHASQ